jgi:hypothetical protein
MGVGAVRAKPVAGTRACLAPPLFRMTLIMRRAGYWLGVALLIAGGAAAVAEILAHLQGGPTPLSLGAIWYRVHANSLVGFQGLIERGVSPLLWPPIQWLLTLPTWLVLAPPGLLLVLFCRDRGR